MPKWARSSSWQYMPRKVPVRLAPRQVQLPRKPWPATQLVRAARRVKIVVVVCIFYLFLDEKIRESGKNSTHGRRELRLRVSCSLGM